MVHEAIDQTQNLQPSRRLQSVKNFDWEKFSKDAFERLILKSQCGGLNSLFYIGKPQLYGHFFSESPTFDIFWRCHPNEIEDKHKNKLMRVSYSFIFQRLRNNVITFKHEHMLFL